MNQLMIVSLFCCLLNIANVIGLEPLGLRAAAYLRGILFGAEANTGSIRGNIDYGHHNSKFTDNYVLMVSENEMKQQHI